MSVDIEKTLINQPSVADLTEIICRQTEDIKRLENVLKHYDWIETAKQPPTGSEENLLGCLCSGDWYCCEWTEIVSEPDIWPFWCRIRPINRRKS